MAAKVGQAPAQNMVVSITRSNTFGFSKSLSQEYSIGRWARALIYFDRHRKRIAFRFTNDRTHPASFALNQTATGGMSIRANGSFSMYDINVQRHAADTRFSGTPPEH
jgi:hypothetical protein